MENIKRAYLIGALIAALYCVSGIVATVLAGADPMLIMACVFSITGVVAAFYGAKKADIAWWAAGFLVAGFITPTVWGFIPMIIALLYVLVVAWMLWTETKKGR
ncbi:MAG: hypothetical protein ACTHUY_06630 [Flaviflexus sp.]|uniref:Uncharacterized protein n=1 Tax=Flaviflexus ciconiae TaxID=2496867 RepID=A0A3Q9G6F5_9ACTO|nr:hypothetical protein [Flaviflexus ciconiae]AZQ76849.1 hypothetical protein EJ997_05355 [Flaviflexus ciconiae]